MCALRRTYALRARRFSSRPSPTQAEAGTWAEEKAAELKPSEEEGEAAEGDAAEGDAAEGEEVRAPR